MLSGFCCFCFMLLYKIRKTFGSVFLGYCCRFLRTLLLFSLDAAVVFSGCRYLFSGDCRRFLRFLPFLFHAFVQKLLEFVQNRIFFVQKAERISACLFSFSGYILSGSRTFLLFSLTIANRKSCFWRSDRPQMAGFILVSRMFFMPFPDRLDRFFGFFLLLFLHFSVVCRQKKLCCSFIRIIRFRDFFASSGYFFCPVLRNFFIPFPCFQCFS